MFIRQLRYATEDKYNQTTSMKGKKMEGYRLKFILGIKNRKFCGKVQRFQENQI